MKSIFAIARKEISITFGSPMALIFIGAFLAATLFAFFWIDTFFARGIADLRPLFRWLPLLLVFLVAALTMRQWSHEDESGTLEVLLTLPVSFTALVLGKFLAILALVSLALALTVSLPITVSLLGNLDWGPVIGGYLAALLMASAYTALGLFISSRTRNDIVALIATVAVGGVLYLLGTRGLTELAGGEVAAWLRAVATSSRFESIERGVVDLRDLVYYASLTAIFLALNVLSLDSRRWSRGRNTASYRHNATAAVSLLAVNLVLLNGWLHPLTQFRVDITQQREYTLSPPTRNLLQDLQEPLLLRAYISERTHPLLAPLAPRIQDMLAEYEIAGGGQVVVEVIDPIDHPDLEAEANQTYGIRPTPFQIAGRYEASVVNAYFDILVRYGDQSQVINFRDLIAVEAFRDGQLDVRLRNLEYDLTRAINRVVYGFQNLDSILASLPAPARLTLVVTPETLPTDLVAAPDTIRAVAEQIASDSGGQLTFDWLNPDDTGARLNRDALLDGYGIRPFAASLFSDTTYYLHMILQVGDQAQLVYPSGDLTEADIRQVIESGLKRFSSGFLQVVGVWHPEFGPDPIMAQLGQNQPQLFSTWDLMKDTLSQDYEVRTVDLATGNVPPDVDVMLVLAPQDMTDVERFALDQFLMRGGALIVAGSSFRVQVDSFTGMLSLTPIEDGLHDMLAHYGVDIARTLVMDPQNESFPIQVPRIVGGFQVQEIQPLNYPYFVDVRSDGMAAGDATTANLPAITLNWVSPVTATTTSGRTVTTLFRSTSDSWTRDALDIQPDPETYPEYGFPPGEPRAAQSLAVSVIGSFESYFAGKEPPITPSSGDASATAAALIPQSPASARLVVIGSGDFVNDTVFSISSQLSVDRYLNSLQFIQNTIDWSVEDLDLLSIRARGASTRLLMPLSPTEQTSWEVANYTFALLSLLMIGLWWASYRRTEKPMSLHPDTPNAVDSEVTLEQH